MRIGIIPVLFLCICIVPVRGQETDSIKVVELTEVVISNSFRQRAEKQSALTIEVATPEFLKEHFTGNLMRTLGSLPGIHSMDIGSGFSKPMIRGLGFNRILVVDNGIRQEGQQWGADHGVEIDAFATEQVVIQKGPASLRYGSDAMGGVIELLPFTPPSVNQVFGEAVLLGKSVNGTAAFSLMGGMKKDHFYFTLRYSEQHFGDLRVPADTVVYLTRRLPIEGRRLKNTAGYERDGSLYATYRKGAYGAGVTLSNAYQKVGFFPGAHGIPDISRLQHDGSHRNIELPYSRVNHFKTALRQQYNQASFSGSWDLGYQHNLRQEWSEFHTHYGDQAPPARNPDKELEFSLHTLSSSLKFRFFPGWNWQHEAGWDVQYQHNAVDGYSFLIPRYRRFTSGLFWISTWQIIPDVTLTGGLRYDYGYINASSYTDPYLENYLREREYGEETIQQYRQRSYGANRSFSDFSGSMGIMWQVADNHLLKLNAGRSFRLPGAYELVANGLHHGAFRHEQGDNNLNSERGWQLDLSYTYRLGKSSFSLSPFVTWFDNYIYLQPTGEWSILPHAGQIYRYGEAKARLMGGEISAEVPLYRGISYRFSGEYLHTWNRDEKIPLSFSPPASMSNTFRYEKKNFAIHTEVESFAAQNRIARNEDTTPGATLWHGGISTFWKSKHTDIEISLSVHNILDKAYYNHLSFYRKIEVPEPGRNIQIYIKIPFKFNKL